MSTYLHHFFVYIYFQELSVYESTYVNNAYTPKFRPLKTLVNVSTSLFRIYIFSRTISLRINVCQQRIYPEISMFKNNCQRIYVTFSYIYIFTYYQHTINIFTSHFSYIYIFHNYQSFLTFLFFTCYIRLFACYLFNCYIHVIYILYISILYYFILYCIILYYIILYYTLYYIFYML